jgi:hypothetical protein
MNAENNTNWIAGLTGNLPLNQVLASTPAAASPGSREEFEMPNLHVGSGYRYGNLDWFPIWSDTEVTPRDYVTKAAQGQVRVGELAHPSVAQVVLENLGNDNLLIFEGTLLEAGFQHRALIRTVFVAANSSRELPVVCVERGRWGGAVDQQLGERRAPAKVRAALRGLRREGQRATQNHADQGVVWNEVNQYGRTLKNLGGTESLVELRQVIDRDARLPKVHSLPGQIGVMVGIAGHPIALELFDHPDTLAERLESILQGYLPDAMPIHYAPTPGYRARAFLQKAGSKKLFLTPQAPLLRNRPDPLVATEAFVHANRLVHISTLNVKHELVLAA